MDNHDQLVARYSACKLAAALAQLAADVSGSQGEMRADHRYLATFSIACLLCFAGEAHDDFPTALDFQRLNGLLSDLGCAFRFDIRSNDEKIVLN